MPDTKAKPLDLSHFYGTVNWHVTTLLRRRLLATDGMKYIADECGAYWIHDLVASYQIGRSKAPQRCNGFQCWRLRSDGKGGAYAECFTDEPFDKATRVVQQHIEYCSFPFDRLGSDTFDFWAEGGCTEADPLVVMLKSER